MKGVVCAGRETTASVGDGGGGAGGGGGPVMCSVTVTTAVLVRVKRFSFPARAPGAEAVAPMVVQRDAILEGPPVGSKRRSSSDGS